MTPARRKPHCQKCGNPMAGHMRPQGVPECPSLPSPPPTPFKNRALKTVNSLSEIPDVVDGHYRRVNPNWSSPEPVPGPSVPQHARHASLAPTEPDEPVEEDSKERVHERMLRERVDRYRYGVAAAQEEDDGSEDSDRPPSPSSSTGDSSEGSTIASRAAALIAQPSLAALHGLLKGNKAQSAALYNASPEEINDIARGARKLGLHAGAIHKPRARRHSDAGVRAEGTRPVQRDSSWWMVLGQDKHAVDHLLDMQDNVAVRGLDLAYTQVPGAATDLRPEPYNLGTPRGIVFSQLLLASALGGLIMFAGLSSI